MDERQAREVAENLDTDPELLPYLDELLADLDELGCNLERIVEALRGLQLPKGSRALDLACGKGAVSLALAERLGCEVEGVDLFAPFIARARALAERRGLESRCRFRAVDMRQALDRARALDVVIYSAVGALGAHDQAVARMRQAVRPGGLIVIDDGYLDRADAIGSEGFAHYSTLAVTRARLTAHGDRLVHETLLRDEDRGPEQSEETELIRQRARAIAAREPEAAALVNRFVAQQEEECAFLDAHFISALWILERAADPA